MFAHGVMNWSKTDHWGYTLDTGVMLKVVNGRLQGRVSPNSQHHLRTRQHAQPIARPHGQHPSPASCCLDGLTNGAVYALLGLATVLVFAVTRVIFIPQGSLWPGALTLAVLQTGKVPGTDVAADLRERCLPAPCNLYALAHSAPVGGGLACWPAPRGRRC